MNLGLLDLPSPLWDLVDDGLASVGLPALARVMLYAIASAWISMAIYRRTSRQAELATLATESRALRAELADYDGEFAGLMQRVRRLMRLSLRHLGLSFVPAMLGGLPLLFVLPWLSNTFSHELPTPGTVLEFRTEGLSVPGNALRWHGIDAPWDAQISGWHVAWPDAPIGVELKHGETSLLALPLPAPSSVVHRYLPALNVLMANPAGYLPDASPLDAIRLDLPTHALLPWGPDWLRGWPAVYFITMLAASLAWKWRWRLQ
jgi:hypothetical protein